MASSAAPDRPGSDAVQPDVASKAALELLRAVTSSRPGGEDRVGQQRMTELVARAAVGATPLIVQAGTGVGKSLAYLCGGLGARARLVVSTATRQLSDQLLMADAPAAVEAQRVRRGRLVSVVVLKGRSNYVCLAKVAELQALDRRAPSGPADGDHRTPSSALAAPASVVELGLELELPEPVRPTATSARQRKSKRAKDSTASVRAQSGRGAAGGRPSAADLRALAELLEWIGSEPASGERSAGPAVPDRTWYEVSTDAAGCPGVRSCPVGEDCFAEAARAQARAADVVIINHALLARDLISPSPLFDDRDLIVVDEVHELESHLSAAWGHEVTAGLVDRTVAAAVRRVARGDADAGAVATAVQADAAALSFALDQLPAARFDAALPNEVDGPLAALFEHGTALAENLDRHAKRLAESELDKAAANAVMTARGQLVDLVNSIAVLRKTDPAVVRWSSESEVAPAVLRAAPLEVGQRFRAAVGERALVATSATASVAGDFAPVARMLGLADEPDLHTEDVGSPFNYQTQAIRYLPTHLPEPVGRERTDHTAAVLTELTELVTAAQGRTLALFTTGAAARNAAARLRSEVSQTVLEHGELPAATLAAEFADDETSILCATMGMWSGLNVVGPACSLVVIDKIPFAPMDDPLASARRAAIDAAGGNGFREVYVTRAALMLTQGVGRLIRSASDRGVVAILDPRLRTKGYGPLLLKSLPPMWSTDDAEVVRAALRRLAQGPAATGAL